MAFSFTSPSPQPQQPLSLFQSPAQPSPFQQQQQPQLFPQQQPFQQQQLFQQPQPQQQQQQQQPMYASTNDKAPASYNTKWADLHPDSQKVLLQIEERILEYRDESQRLDQCSRLYDSSVSSDGFELDASRIVQELGGNNTGMEREKLLLQELMAVIKNMMRNTEVAVRSFMILRPRFIHSSNPSPSTATTSTQTPAGAIIPSSSSQPMSSSAASVVDFYSGIPKRPSPFLQQTVARFEKYLSECQQRVEELEQLLLSFTDGRSSGLDLSLLQSLPKVMANVHDFFVHVAAKVEGLHQYIESMKAAYIADQRRRGDGSDPFLEADRRETAKLEAAARRVHPTLHIPAQPSTQVAGLFSSSATAGALGAPQPSVGPSAPSSGSGFSIFTPSSSAPPAASSSSFFSTPSTSAPTSSLFGTSSFSPQPSLLGTTPSLFGTPQAPSLFGTPQTPSLFGSTPSFSTSAFGSSQFSTPFASGAATGSGASFGIASKSAKPKSRSTRR